MGVLANSFYILFTPRVVVCPKVGVITAPVLSLLTPSGPLAIVRTIPLVIINALKSVFRRGLWPHISKKFTRIFQPFIAHFYSSAAVIIPIFDVRVGTSSFGTIVGSEFRWTFSTYCGPMSHTRFRNLFISKASTTDYFTTSKAITPNAFFSTAVALTKPYSLPPFLYFFKRNDSEPSVSISDYIFKSSHRVYNTIIQTIVNTFYQVRTS